MRANIPIENLSADKLLEDWIWLLKKPYSSVALSSFADMFLQDERGKICFLELATRKRTRVAERIVEFQRLSSDVSNQERWFLLGLLTELERAGMQIASGECFGLKKPPALGGRIELSSMEIAPLYV